MEGKLGGNCLVCGGEVGSVNCNDGGSPSPFESFFNSFQSSVQGEVNFEGKWVTACEGCSEKVILVQNGKEKVEGLQKEVSILEGNLQKKLLELGSAGERHLSGLKELELLIKNGSQQKDPKKNVDYLREGTGKALSGVAETLKIVEGKKLLLKRQIDMDGGIIAEIESTPGLVSTALGLNPSVVLLAAENEVKMEGIDVHRMKVESKDAVITTTKEPTAKPEHVVKKIKLEKELIGTVRHGITCRRRQNPFELFPQEIWEMMLEQMDDSKDILTILREIPQLDICIGKQKRFWFIDQILPFLGNLIKKTDVLNLRLVCKQWQSRVDNFLPNQPYCRAYSEDLHKDNLNFWTFLEYEGRKNFEGNSPHIPLESIAESPLSKVAQMMEHPPTRNPFVFRNLDLDIVEIDKNENGKAEKMFDFLQQCGSHLWFLYVSLGIRVQHSEINTLIRILKLTRNLKSLTVEMKEHEEDIQQHDKSCLSGFEKKLPELPFLESFKMLVEPGFEDLVYERGHEISRGLIMRYGPQIKRMKMDISHWRTEYKDLFPKLTELESLFWFQKEESDILKLENLIYSIVSPSLVKLELSFWNPKETPMPFTIQQDIFKWLKRFPQIKYFDLCTDVIEQFSDELRLEADPIKDCIPSIQKLKIVDGHGLSYEILHCFPNLRHLEITCYDRPSVVDLSMPDSCVKIREQLQTAKLYESNIWELFPKLRNITLVAFKTYTFNRETYEKLKKAGKIPSEPQLHDPREDIQHFLKSIAGVPTDTRLFHWTKWALLHNSENVEYLDDFYQHATISDASGSDNDMHE